MKNYFLKNGTRESGPYMLDDLKYQRINADTQVKEEGGPWQLVSQNRDLRFLLQMSEGSNSYSDSGGSMKKQQNNPDSGRPEADQAKARMMVLVAIAVAFAVAGLAMSLFFMTN
ncbi:MAG: hypothetical protein HYZ14_07570 [Bacteroidetes bacterium]|nr:hypothetical protein [Bacteroidota bacterium]